MYIYNIQDYNIIMYIYMYYGASRNKLHVFLYCNNNIIIVALLLHIYTVYNHKGQAEGSGLVCDLYNNIVMLSAINIIRWSQLMSSIDNRCLVHNQ